MFNNSHKSIFTIKRIISSLSNFKNGFTLAEVLMAMTLVGVIAMMTLPNLSNQFKKNEYSTKLKKFVSSVNNAFIQMEAEKGSQKNLKKPTTITAAYTWYMDNLDGYIGHQMVNKSARKVYYKDGSMLYFVKLGDCVDLMYDVNGNKKPNKNGVDEFYFLICYTNDKRSWFFGSQASNFGSYGKNTLVRKSTTRTTLINACASNPSFCSRLLELDGWEFKKDYPFRIK